MAIPVSTLIAASIHQSPCYVDEVKPPDQDGSHVVGATLRRRVILGSVSRHGTEPQNGCDGRRATTREPERRTSLQDDGV
ncbi:hypothetical protein F5X99DRAFT_410249 [Biscogniauxia marginata]|nr:hypothetical protein F5X99DRAFT_410249 [Biscogniauxia marginata]